MYHEDKEVEAADERGQELDPEAENTIAALNLVSIVEGFDLQLLPSIFGALQIELGWSIGKLSTLIFSQGVAVALSSFCWGLGADNATSRVKLLSAGCAIWGVANVFLSFSSHFWQFLVLKLLEGIAIASVAPLCQSMIADLCVTSKRGRQFGWIQMYLNAGCILGAVAGGVLSNVTIVANIKGWRLVVLLCGMSSLTIASAIVHFSPEPPRATKSSQSNIFNLLWTNFEDIYHSISLHTAMLLMIEGICWSIPYHAFSFFTLWFQYIGMPDYEASLLTACPLLGAILGSVLGGWLGDRAMQYSRYKGRLIVGQIGIGLTIPLMYVGLMLIPRRADRFRSFAFNMLLAGFFVSWSPAGVNRPVLSDVVQPNVRATVFALLTAFEGMFATLFSSPVIAFLAESCFGFDATVTRSPGGEHNTEALAEALLICTVIPWTVCVAMYVLACFTYESDVKATQYRLQQENFETVEVEDVALLSYRGMS